MRTMTAKIKMDHMVPVLSGLDWNVELKQKNEVYI